MRDCVDKTANCVEKSSIFKDHIPYTEYKMVQIKHSIEVKISADMQVLISHTQP